MFLKIIQPKFDQLHITLVQIESLMHNRHGLTYRIENRLLKLF